MRDVRGSRPREKRLLYAPRWASRQACIFRVSSVPVSRVHHAAGDSHKAPKSQGLARPRKQKTSANFSLTHVGKGLSLFFDNQATETLILWRFEPRVRREDRHRRGARPLHQPPIALEIADFERRQAALGCA